MITSGVVDRLFKQWKQLPWIVVDSDGHMLAGLEDCGREIRGEVFREGEAVALTVFGRPEFRSEFNSPVRVKYGQMLAVPFTVE